MNKNKMKLEIKFFTAFFYQFLICIFLSSLVVIIILITFTDNKLDKRTRENIINLQKNYSKIIINTANIILTTKLLKFQSGLNELILYYLKSAKELLQSNKNYELNDTFLKSVLSLDFYFCDYNLDEASKSAFWLLDDETTEYELDEKIDVKQQLIAFSNIIQNIDTNLETTKPNVNSFYFYFEKTELYIFFPIIEACDFYLVYSLVQPFYEYTLYQCLDENGLYYPNFKFKCETVYTSIKKSKSNIYDNNYMSNKDKTIFIINFYDSLEYDYEALSVMKFAVCIEFDDPITKGKGYACAEGTYRDIIYSLEDLNSKISGYFFISNVGYNNLFYFPKGTGTPKTSTEMMYKWDLDYRLLEKTNFHINSRKIFSSNYIDNIGDSIYDEVFVNGKNSTNQTFHMSNEEFKYSIFPIILENLNGNKEHIMSLIYVYQEELFLNKIDDYISSIVFKVILILLFFIIFSYFLLYLIYLTFNTLVKYIVIPIKNVNYMLKGINIGGLKRLEYLDYLKKNQDDIFEKLMNAFLVEDKKDNEELNIDPIDIDNNQDNEYFINKENIKDKEEINKELNKYSEINNKYDEENNYIEKEYNFYDFDEQLLQYRSLEIKKLIKSLMDLKIAINLTSKDREKQDIIKYSESEQIFRKFKNKEAEVICQSNIGNLQSQLLKFDKTIYHLALSLEDNKLKKFFDQNLSNELDEDNSLFNKIMNIFSEIKKNGKNNILMQKQMNKSKNKFSQKLIGILINIRYPRLIYAYYMFFKKLQKMVKLDNDSIKGQFMNTKFHTINYYNKIIIQFICLCYIKNDLVKIGESILDYIEFLIKFKFKTLSKDKYLLKINNKNRSKYKEKQNYKKKIFDRIINWFNLFDNYISYAKDNSSLNNTKCIIDDYSHNLNSENIEYNLESQTVFMFRINIQKNNFLKGKFCLYCKNYNDALFYFIRAAKKKSIVIDGLIKKRSLKHIYKLLIKMNKKCKKFGIENLNIKEHLTSNEINSNKITDNKFNIKENKEEKIKIIFGKELQEIKGTIKQDINECNAKQERDIIILIDFNIYNKKEENLSTKKYKIDAFIEETILILNNYLSSTDKLSVFIYYNKYQIICPLMNVDKIDNKSFSKDLNYYKNKIINNHKKIKEFNNLDIKSEENIEFNLDGNILREQSQEESFELNDNEEQNYNKINGLIKTINYINIYSKIKEGIKNEKYFIIFTDMLDMTLIEEEEINNIFENLKGNKYATLLLVGKNKKLKQKESIENDINIIDLILDKFGEKSEIIYFENMKMIKTILSNNKVIKDQIFFPNEIYK